MCILFFIFLFFYFFIFFSHVNVLCNVSELSELSENISQSIGITSFYIYIYLSEKNIYILRKKHLKRTVFKGYQFSDNKI